MRILISLILGAALSLPAFAEKPPSYEEAREEAINTGKPLVVYVTADSCPPCITTWKQVVVPAYKAGKLKGFCFCVVNATKSPGYYQILKVKSTPSLVVFSKRTDGWKRTVFTGEKIQQGLEK